MTPFLRNDAQVSLSTKKNTFITNKNMKNGLEMEGGAMQVTPLS